MAFSLGFDGWVGAYVMINRDLNPPLLVEDPVTPLSAVVCGPNDGSGVGLSRLLNWRSGLGSAWVGVSWGYRRTFPFRHFS